MNTFEDQIRVALHKLAEEAVPMNLADHALRGSRRRKVTLATAGAAVFAAVSLSLAPLALANVAGNTHPQGNPAPPATTPAEPSPQAPQPSPTVTTPPPPQTTPSPTDAIPATPTIAATPSPIESTPPPFPTPTRS